MAIKYYHIPEQRKTVATLCGTERDAINMIWKQLGYSDIVCPFGTKYLMPKMFRAVVVCHPDDEYDEKLGEKFAKEKLMRKYYDVLDTKFLEFAQELYDVTSKVVDIGCDCECKCDKN